MSDAWRDHTLILRDLTFHYLEWGEPSRPPLVLLHGLTGHAHIWDHMAPALSERWHIFAPDQRGHGDSSHAPTYSTQDYVDDLEALRQAWDIDRFDLIGLSMGGHNGLAYAHQHPERVRRLVVIDIPPKLDLQHSPQYEQWQRTARDGHAPFATFLAAWIDARAGSATAPDANLEHRTIWNLREVGADASVGAALRGRPDLASGPYILKWDPKAPSEWDTEDLWPKLPDITTPTLLVRAGKTEYLSEHTAAKMVNALGQGAFAEIAESGHSIPTDAPELLLPVVVEWLSADQ